MWGSRQVRGESPTRRLWDKRYSRQWFPRPRNDDSCHPVCFQEIVKILLNNTPATTRCVPYEHSIVVAHNDAAMEHIEVLACRCEEDEIARLQMPDQPSNSRPRHACKTGAFGGQSRNVI